MTKKQFAEHLIRSLELHPDEWKFSQYEAVCGNVTMWIENRPYADLTIGGMRVGNFFQRRRMRKLMDAIRFQRMCASLGNTPREDSEVLELKRMFERD